MKNIQKIAQNFYANPEYEITHRIYVLMHPLSKNVIYVGCTERPLEVRLRYHIIAAYKEAGSMKKHGFIREMVNAGIYPTIHLVEEVVTKKLKEISKVREIEKFWVSDFSERYDLLNTMYITNKT